MAWDVKYYCEFTDDLGVDWLVNFEQDGSFTATELQASGNPLFIEWLGDDDIQNTNIMGSRASLTVESLSDFAYSDLFSSDILATRVTIKHGVTEFWHGFVLPNTWQEPYDGVPYSVTIEATDGLGLLSDYKFKDLAYTERQTLAQIIHDVLALVQIDAFTEYINIYESTMDDTTGDSPLLQCGIDPDLFKEQTCYEALSEILKSLNAGIRQDNGVFELFRFIEIAGTMHGRAFTSPTIKSYTSKAPAQKINRPSNTSNLCDMNGGTRMIIPQLKTININQDYGFKKSVFKNYNFPYDEFTWNVGGGYFTLNNWTRVDSCNIQPVSVTAANILGVKRSLTNTQDGVLINDRSSAGLNDCITQTITGAIGTTEKIIVEVEAGLKSNNGSDDTGTFYISIISTDGVDTKYFDSSIADWNDTEAYILSVEDINDQLNFKTYSFSAIGVPYSGDLIVKAWEGYRVTTANAIAAFKNILVYWVNDDGIAPEGIGYVVTNANSGQTIDREYKIGDGYGFTNDHLQYAGALNIWSGSDPLPTSKMWYTRGHAQMNPLIFVIGQEFGEQYERQKDLVDLPLFEKTSATFLKLNGNLQDSYNVYSPGLNRIFAISRAMYDVRKREYNLTLTEIIQ